MRTGQFFYKNLEAYWGPPEPLCINLSGGRTSAYQAAHLIEANGGLPQNSVVVFENTSLERPETYDFLVKFEEYFKIAVVWLEFDPTVASKFRVVTPATAKRDGEVMEALINTPLNRRDGTHGVRPLPNPAQRTCTANMKIKTAHRYLRQVHGWPTNYYAAIGYRADERRRYDRHKKLELSGNPEGGLSYCPMVEAGVTANDVADFWDLAPFNLEMDSIFGNCDLCFMASTWKIKERMLLCAMEQQIKPQLSGPLPTRVARWVAWEERESDRPGVFRKDRPNYRQLWEQVCRGEMDSAVPEGKDDRCGSCTD